MRMLEDCVWHPGSDLTSSDSASVRLSSLRCSVVVVACGSMLHSDFPAVPPLSSAKVAAPPFHSHFVNPKRNT